MSHGLDDAVRDFSSTLFPRDTHFVSFVPDDLPPGGLKWHWVPAEAETLAPTEDQDQIGDSTVHTEHLKAADNFLTSKLCEKCSTISPELFLPGHTAKHVLDRQDVARGSDEDCGICLLLSGTLRSKGESSELTTTTTLSLRSEWTRSELATGRAWLAVYADAKLLFRFRIGVAMDNELSQHFRDSFPAIESKESFLAALHGIPQSGQLRDPDDGDREYRPLQISAEHPDNFKLMNHWLDECMEKHQSCKIGGMHVDEVSFVLPKRLIDVDDLHLVDSSTLPRTSEGYGPPYMTLSHCWGPNPDFVPECTKANVATLYAGIDFDKLPKTFKDAITVTRQVRVQYLWIDSLCIIQDDPEDKGPEIARMHLIYSMAICLIAASASPDSRGGCFTDRTFQGKADAASLALTYQNTEMWVFIQPYLNSFSEAISNGPLSQRGWCFQERQLSKRIIHFTENRIAWECRDAIASEEYPGMSKRAWWDARKKAHCGPDRLLDCVPAGVNFSRPNWEDELALRTRMLRIEPRMQHINESSAYWMGKWCEIIEEYSARKLSFPSDRLPALGGLAAMIAAFMRSPFEPRRNQYLAGLFYADVFRHLCWFPDMHSRSPLPSNASWPPPLKGSPSYTSKTVTNTPTLPSWSWVSLEGPVCYYGISDFENHATIAHAFLSSYRVDHSNIRDDDLIPKLEDARVDLCDTFTYGAVSAGILEITGLAFDISLSEAAHLPYFDSASLPKCYRIYSTLDESSTSNLRNDLSLIVHKEGIIYFDTDPPHLPDIHLVCLRLGSKASIVPNCKPVEVGLVLAKVPDDDLTAGYAGKLFRRVGLFEIGVWHEEYMNAVGKRSAAVI